MIGSKRQGDAQLRRLSHRRRHGYLILGTLALAVGWSLLAAPPVCYAQARQLSPSVTQLATPPGDPPSDAAEPATSDKESLSATALGERQARLSDQFLSLERRLLERAELEAATNPQRAALLKQAFARGRQMKLPQRLRTAAEALSGGELAKAAEQQKTLAKDIQGILDLLLSEGHADRAQQERDKIESHIREVERLLRLQRSVEGRTEGGEDLQRLSQDESKLAERTAELLQRMRPAREANRSSEKSGQTPTTDDPSRSDAQATEPPANSPQDGTPQNGTSPPNGEQNTSPSERGPADPSDASQTPDGNSPDPQPGSDNRGASNPTPDPASEGNPSQGNPSQGNPSQGNPSQGNPSQGNPSQGSPSQGESSPSESGSAEGDASESNEAPAASQPGETPVQQAERRMREAEQALRAAQRDEALQKEREAERLLEQAKAELHRILRQMREKEVEQTLAQLEGRFRKMLEMQLRVNEGTQALPRNPTVAASDPPDRETLVRASKLSLEERQIVLEADKALALLREEGSSVVFPEVATQMREDMQQIAHRLDATQIDAMTLALEADVVATLEEILSSLKMARKEGQEKTPSPSPPPNRSQGGPQQEQPLVNALAELKMLRNLQLRVNQRTDQVAAALQNPDDLVGQATTDELTATLRRLSERESRLHEITRDIVVGRNQ